MKLESVFEICMNSGMLSLDWDEKESIHLSELNEREKLLLDSLDDEQKKLFRSFRYDLVWHMFSVRDEECMDTFRLGFRIGKELQKADDEEEMI